MTVKNRTLKEEMKANLMGILEQDMNQYDNSNTTVTQQYDNNTTTVTEQYDNSNTTVTEHGINLPEKQLIIYKWFLKRGLTGTFNKPLIVCETGIHYETIRRTLRKFDKLKILNILYDTCMKEYDYELNKNIVIKNN